MLILFRALFLHKVMAVCSVNFPMLLSRYFYPLFDRYKCAYVTSNLFIYSACIWRWGSLQRESGTSPPATCSQLALPQDTPALAPKPAGLQGCGTASHCALREIALGYPFRFICFHPFIGTGAYRWITVLCFAFSFSFYDKLFGFSIDAYMICQGFFFIGSARCEVCFLLLHGGPGHLFCQ